MKKDLKNYVPEHIEYVLEEAVKEQFPLELDFLGLKKANLLGEKPLKTKSDALKFVAKHFTSTFPDNELVTRKLDEFEIHNIREEYCMLQENEVKKRKDHLQETLERIKLMKKEAEDAYNSVLLEIEKYAAEVKLGTKDIRLKSTEVFSIAIAGHYCIYVWDEGLKKFVLANAYPIPDRSEIWANEEKNRKAMLEVFGLEFPEVENPNEQKEAEDGKDNNGNDLPFGDEGGDNSQAPASRQDDDEDD